MSEYEFSVIKYVPDIVRLEPVNIGIALLDRKNRRLYRRYITNFDDMFKRLGVENVNGLEKSFENYKPVETVDSEDMLHALHDSFPCSIFYSEPTAIYVKKVDDMLEQIFDKMISIRDRSKTVRKIVVNIGNEFAPFHISKAGRDFLRARLGNNRPDRGEYAEQVEFERQTDGRTRHDPVLVEMVETLKEKSYNDVENYRHRLGIIEIPDDIEYVIVRDDNAREHVEEKHRKWYYKDD